MEQYKVYEECRDALNISFHLGELFSYILMGRSMDLSHTIIIDIRVLIKLLTLLFFIYKKEFFINFVYIQKYFMHKNVVVCN